MNEPEIANARLCAYFRHRPLLDRRVCGYHTLSLRSVSRLVGLGNLLHSFASDGILGDFTASMVAGVAQLAEHRFCKPTVVSSSLTASSARNDAVASTERRNGAGPRLSRSLGPAARATTQDRVDTQAAKGARL